MKTFLVQVLIDAEVTVEAENEQEAREQAASEVHFLSNGEVDISDVDIVSVEEFDD